MNNNQVRKFTPQQIEKSAMNQINTRIIDFGMKLPEDLNYQAIIASSMTLIKQTQQSGRLAGKSFLEICTPESVANALYETALMGLNPALKQSYFIPYGDKLTVTPSYFGVIKILNEMPEVEKVNAVVVYQGDKITRKYNQDGELIIDHEINSTPDDDIIGGYCVIKLVDGSRFIDYMTSKEIIASWRRSKTFKGSVDDIIVNKPQGNSVSPHAEQPSQMVKRTVIKRAAKMFVNTRPIYNLSVETMVDNEEKQIKDVTPVYQEKSEDELLLEEQFKQQFAENTQEEVEVIQETPRETLKQDEMLTEAKEMLEEKEEVPDSTYDYHEQVEMFKEVEEIELPF